MGLRTPLCDLLDIEHPILLAGMGGVSYAPLAAAVSGTGGYGVLGMAGTSPDFIRDQMRQVRQLTDKPFGVDLLAATPDALTASVEVIIEEGASSFVAGLGVPLPIIERLKSAGLKVMVVCGAVKHAVKAEQAGCDAVICQGGEGGGHTGLVGTLPLVAQAVEAVKIPVVGAGCMTAEVWPRRWPWAPKASGWAPASSPRPKPMPATSIAGRWSRPPTRTPFAPAATRASRCG